VARALGLQGAPIDEERGVVEPRWGAPGDPLGNANGEQAGERRVGDGIEDQEAAWSQHPAGLGHCCGHVGDVLEDLPGTDHVGDAARQRQGHGVAPDGSDAVAGGEGERRGREVDADMAVALRRDMGGQETGPACHVDKDRPADHGRRDERCPRLGDPVQHGKGPEGVPPLVDEVVVLPEIVAGLRFTVVTAAVGGTRHLR